MCPHCRSVPLLLALLVSFLAGGVFAGEPLSKAELSKRGKEASALLELRPRNSYATAFCVNPSGLFLTTEQAGRQIGEADGVTLILLPGLKNQQISRAKVVRRDPNLNLALLRIEGARSLPSLALGSDDDLAELLELAAFDFPVRAN